MDTLNLLRTQIALQMEWGADEFLLDSPQDRRQAAPPALEIPKQATPPTAAAKEPSPPRPTRAAKPLSTLPGPTDAARIAAACESLDALKSAMNAFTGCALRDTATQLVFADGAEDARILLIGEAPGADEDRIGRPFVGAAGQLLDKMLASIQLDRTKIRIINVIPWRPPGNRAPTDAEIAVCLPFLHRQITLINPACLVLLGGTAAKAMAPEAARPGIRRLRGQWQSLEIPGISAPVPTLPIFHPAYLLRTPSAKREAWHDLLALKSWLGMNL